MYTTVLNHILKRRLRSRSVCLDISRLYSELGDQLFFCKLATRALVQADGPDVASFLQGLITNDMQCINMRCGVPSMYSMFLNTKGRVMNDLILYHSPHPPDTSPDKYFIECDHQLQKQFVSDISKYKIRKKVTLKSVSDLYNVWSIFPHDLRERNKSVEIQYEMDKNQIVADSHDPRLKSFGRRLILPSNYSVSDVVSNVIESHLDCYKKRRFYFGIGEGALDLPCGNALPLDSNAVFMNGVSFDKGCYIGQELTARTHHTGVIRKRLMPIEFDREDHGCESEAEIYNGKGKKCGKLRDSCGKYGLAMLRIPDVINKGTLYATNASKETINISTKIPWWWPKDKDPIIKQVLAHTV